ncbi:hypothetical protein ALC56_07123 [Trachymyrmex septentrionalis]|uniref:Uncharacterized protein n=1 Tax=Trachymyrmex septentrionalis TaxID=34720 RepID=A0A151JWA2_9HYME|nr:hypothetical protein ALC56_07123 [Trachymyrmex septentrionalis]
MLERPDFQRITKDTWTGKKRKLQQCPLHDSLTSYQRTAVEERTQLFSAIPGKIMAETLLALDEASSAQRKTSTMRGDFRRRIIVGIEVAKQAVQRLAATAAEVLVRAQEVLFRESSVQRIADERGRIAIPTEAQVQEDTGLPDCLSSSGPERSERWETVSRKKRKRKKRKEETANRGGGLPARASNVASDSAGGTRTVEKGLSYATATRKTRDRETVSGRDLRAHPKKYGAGTTVPSKKTVRARTRKRSSAVVMIRCDEGGPSYADVMSEARTGVPLDELGITDTRVRRAQNGGLLVEIPGEDAGAKADSLSEKLNSLFKNRERVRVIRPVRRTDGHNVAITWTPGDNHVATTWPTRGHHVENTWPLSELLVATTCPKRGYLVAITWPPRGQHVVITWP